MIDFPPVSSGEDMRISASAYAAYRRCAESAAARFRGEYGPETDRAFVGGLGHRVFARHLRDGSIAESSFEQVCREEIGAGMNMKMSSLGVRPSQLAGFIKEVGDLYARFKTLGFEGFRAAEVQLEVEPVPGVVLRGAVDAVFDDEGGVRLVDWKTGGIADDAGHQLGFYALLWVLERRELPGRVEAVSVSSGQRTEVPVGLAEISAIAHDVASMVDVLRTAWAAGTHPARTAGPWCRYCPVLASCSEGQGAAKVLAAR